jgi:hypothetical protein
MRARVLCALAGGSLALAATACAAMRGGGASSGDCAPTPGTLAAGASLAPMAGRFVMTMVATAGPQRGQTVSGYVTLRQAPPGTPAPAAGASTALIGGTDILLETVGALRLGDAGADDPRAPGIAVIEQRSAAGVPTVVARIGSVTTAPPTPGLMAIEGSYTVLYVRRIDAGSFAGGWQSGGPEPGAAAQGYFCAARIG